MSKKYMVNGHTGEVENFDEKPVDLGFFFDEQDAIRHAYRKQDRHKTKGRRRIKGDYKHDYWM